MKKIKEILYSTAIGLLVAIPVMVLFTVSFFGIFYGLSVFLPMYPPLIVP